MPSATGNDSIPAVSVVMPVYNGERFLAEAIESILNQTFADFEFLILDDGSTDRSLKIARSYAEQDDRIRLIEFPHRGLVATLNDALVMARAPWIARLDNDDIARPQRLERQLAVLESQPEIVAIGGWCSIIGETGRVVGAHRFGAVTIEEFNRGRDEGPTYLMSPTVTYSRRVALEVGGYRPDYNPAEDVDLFTRLAERGAILVVPELLGDYRIHPHAASTRRFAEQMQNTRLIDVNRKRRRSGLPEMSKAEFAAMERRQPWLHRTRRSLSIHGQRCYRTGGGLLAAGKKRGVAWLFASFLLAPGFVVRRIAKQHVLRQPVLQPTRPSFQRNPR